MDDDLDTLETPQALDELDDDSERFVGSTLDDQTMMHAGYAGRMRKRHVAKDAEPEIEDPGEWVGVFKSDGGLY